MNWVAYKMKKYAFSLMFYSYFILSFQAHFTVYKHSCIIFVIKYLKRRHFSGLIRWILCILNVIIIIFLNKTNTCVVPNFVTLRVCMCMSSRLQQIPWGSMFVKSWSKVYSLMISEVWPLNMFDVPRTDKDCLQIVGIIYRLSKQLYMLVLFNHFYQRGLRRASMLPDWL